MYILVWLWFILILLGIIVWVIFIALYNTLIHLHTTCQNTAKDLCALREAFWKKTKSKTAHDLIAWATKASTVDKQVVALNKLRSYILDATFTEKQLFLDKEHALQTEKRFFNNTARELEDRLNTFPTKTIGSIFGLKAPKLFDLDEDAHAWLLPEAKYL